MARPLGATTRPQLRDYLGKEKIDKLTEKAYEVAIEKGDAIMLKFLLEQVYGRAPQPITGENGGAVLIKVAKDIAEKNEVNPNTNDSSEGQT